MGETYLQEKSRDALFDNMKAILIVLVVIGHLTVNVCKQSAVFCTVYYFIYLFHMPAFAFVTGYFSKNEEKCRNTAIKKYLVPYFVFCILLQVESRILNIGVGRNLGFNLLYPHWGMWYMIALFWWKLFLKDLVKIRWILPMSIVVSILSGFSREISVFLGIGRAVNLLFFFLLGYYCTKEKIEKIRALPKVFGVIAVALTGGIAYVMVNILQWDRQFLYMKKYYFKGNEMQEILGRVSVFIFASLMIFGLINLCSGKKRWFTHLGTNSVGIYITHLFIVKIIERFYEFGKMPAYVNGIAILFASIAIALIAGTPFVIKCYNSIVGIVNQMVFKKEVESTRTHKSSLTVEPKAES